MEDEDQPTLVEEIENAALALAKLLSSAGEDRNAADIRAIAKSILDLSVAAKSFGEKHVPITDIVIHDRACEPDNG